MLAGLDRLTAEWAEREDSAILSWAPVGQPDDRARRRFIADVPERCDVALDATYLPGNADSRGYGSIRAPRSSGGGHGGAGRRLARRHRRREGAGTRTTHRADRRHSPIVAVVQEPPRPRYRHSAPRRSTRRRAGRSCVFASTPSPASALETLRAAHAPDEWVGGIDGSCWGRSLRARSRSGAESPMGGPVSRPRSQPSVFLSRATTGRPADRPRCGSLALRPRPARRTRRRRRRAMVTGTGSASRGWSRLRARRAGPGLPPLRPAFTTRPQEELATSCSRWPEGFTRVHLVTGGPRRTRPQCALTAATTSSAASPTTGRIVPGAGVYGPTTATLSLTGRPGPAPPLHAVPPWPTCRPLRAVDLALDPGGGSLEALDRALEEAGPGWSRRSSARPSARAAFRLSHRRALGEGSRTSRRAWVPGLPRRGGHPAWDEPGVRCAAPAAPDPCQMITTGQRGSARLRADGAVLCRDEVYGAIAEGPRVRARAHLGRRHSRAGGSASPSSATCGPRLVEACATKARRSLALRYVTPGRGLRLVAGYRRRPSSWSSISDPRRRSVRPTPGSAQRSTSGPGRRLVGLLDAPDARRLRGDQTLLAAAFTSTDEELWWSRGDRENGAEPSTGGPSELRERRPASREGMVRASSQAGRPTSSASSGPSCEVGGQGRFSAHVDYG